MSEATHFAATIGPVEDMPMPDVINLARNQKITISNVFPQDAFGAPSKVEGDKQNWTTSGPDVCNVLPAADGRSAVFMPVGFGECDIKVAGDADLTPAQKFIERVFHVVVAPLEAVGFAATIGAPEAQ